MIDYLYFMTYRNFAEMNTMGEDTLAAMLFFAFRLPAEKCSEIATAVKTGRNFSFEI